MKKKIQVFFGLLILLAITSFFIWITISLWQWFKSLDSELAVGMLTASTTVIVATITLVLGRYFERAKEAETHLRSQKIEIYDSFLKEFFKLFHEEQTEENNNLTKFLQEWQRKLIVWGGPTVLAEFIKWKIYMANNEANAQSVFLMDRFFRAMRSDIGLSNKNLERGFFAHMILRHSSIFLATAKKIQMLH